MSLKGIQKNLDDDDFGAIMRLEKLEELVLDCDQAPTAEPGVEEMKWGLQGFPEGMEHLVNITHLTLSSHPGITHVPLTVGKLSKLQVRVPQAAYLFFLVFWGGFVISSSGVEEMKWRRKGVIGV